MTIYKKIKGLFKPNAKAMPKVRKPKAAKVVIERVQCLPEATLGVLYIDGDEFCKTLENPWFDNQKYISCIPKGRYTCKWRNSPKFGRTIMVMDVPNRSHILFHAGNLPKDTSGCILLGKKHGKLREQRAVLSSRPAFMSFLDQLRDKTQFILEIR